MAQVKAPIFDIQLELWTNEHDTITLACPVCHKHTPAHKDLLETRAGDVIGCSQCGCVASIPSAA